MMLCEKAYKIWKIDFGEKVTSSAEAMLIPNTYISKYSESYYKGMGYIEVSYEFY